MEEIIMLRMPLRLPAFALVALLAAACAGGTATPEPATPGAATPGAATPAPATDAPTPEPDACAKENLALVTPGTLTIGTDNPAYPPYFEWVETPTSPWELGDPTTGGGFEGAFAYALAEELGFSRDEVEWTVVPFDNAFSPGPKAFDIDINQVSYKPERAQNVDMSEGYYFVNQAVVAAADSAIANATSIADLKQYRFGAQVGTTSYDTIIETIAPTTETSVYNTNDAAIEALKVGQIDAIVVDLPTAFFITAVQFEDGTIVGQFPSPTGADAEHFSVVLGLDSPLTACVNDAIAAMKADGRLEAITQEWLSDQVEAPVFQP
jgi:polar amino acid transport system substrate-binding protein